MKVLYDLFRRVIVHELIGLAAQITFFALFSLFPFLIFLAALIAYLPLGDVYRLLLELVARVAPPEVVPLLAGPMRSATEKHGLLLTAAMALTLVSASAGTMDLGTALNRAFGFDERRTWFWRRLVLAPAITVVLAALVLGTVILLVLGTKLGHEVAYWLSPKPKFVWVWSLAVWMLVLLLPFTALLITYHALAARRLRLRDFVPGAALATVLCVVSSFGLRVYVAHIATFDLVFGSLAAMPVLLLWIYLVSFAVLLGSEFNAILYRSGAKLAPSSASKL